MNHLPAYVNRLPECPIHRAFDIEEYLRQTNLPPHLYPVFHELLVIFSLDYTHPLTDYSSFQEARNQLFARTPSINTGYERLMNMSFKAVVTEWEPYKQLKKTPPWMVPPTY